MARDIGKGRTNVAQIKWRGLDEVLLKLGKQVGVLKGKTRRGLTIVALKIRRDASKLTPIQTGNLRASAYTIVGGGVQKAKIKKSAVKFKIKDNSGRRVQAEHQSVIESHNKFQRDPYAIIGFTAHYALAVHDRVNAVGRRVRTGRVKVGLGDKRVSIKDAQIGQAKFLEEALIKNHKFILVTLAETSKI